MISLTGSHHWMVEVDWIPHRNYTEGKTVTPTLALLSSSRVKVPKDKSSENCKINRAILL